MCDSYLWRCCAREYAASEALGVAFSATCFARWANRSVEIDSSMAAAAGEIAARSSVREFPPKDVCSSRVSTESRYGTWRRLRWVRAPMHVASAERLVLMLAISLR